LVGGGVAGSSFAARAAIAWAGGAGSSSGGGAGDPKGAGVIVITSAVSVPVPAGDGGSRPFDLRSRTVMTGSAAPSDAGETAGAGTEAMSPRSGIVRMRLSIGPGGGAGRATAGLLGS
jgi:hypothetical protein